MNGVLHIDYNAKIKAHIIREIQKNHTNLQSIKSLFFGQKMHIKTLRINSNEASLLCKEITEDLPEYFGLPECNQQYYQGVQSKINFSITVDQKEVGLISIDFPYSNNANIYWMGVLKTHQHKGYGKQLIETATEYAKQHHAKILTVETLSPKESDENYLKTFRFYESLGFFPMFDLKPNGYKWNMTYLCKILD